jgi:hypothetical protein
MAIAETEAIEQAMEQLGKRIDHGSALRAERSVKFGVPLRL